MQSGMINPLLSEVYEDDSTEGHGKKLIRYSEAIKRQRAVAEYILNQNVNSSTGEILSTSEAAIKMLKVAKSLEECGAWLLYRLYYELHKYRMTGGCTCKKPLLCALCAIRRAAKCISIYSEKINHLLKSGDYDAVMINFTIVNGWVLPERYEHLHGSFQKLGEKRRNALKKNPKTDTLFKYIEGAIYSYEITASVETGFHPHIHMIALVPKGRFAIKEMFIKNKKVQVMPELWAGLVKDWKEITGDSKIVDVRVIGGEQDQMRALAETFKYALKMNEMDIKTQVEAYQVLRGRRMIGSMGALFGVKLPDNLNDELLPGEEKFVDILYQYAGSFGYQEVYRTAEGVPLVDTKGLQARYGRKSPRKEVSPDTETVLEMIKDKFEIFRKVAPKKYEKAYEEWLSKNPKEKEPFTKMVDELEWI